MCILILTILSSSVSAVGVGPVFTNLEFEPKFTSDYSFTIYNNDKIDFTAEISITGDLGEYITIDTTTIPFKSLDDSKNVKFKLTLPRDILPGEYKSKIMIIEKSERSGMIGAVAAVSHKLTLIVPKHGKYIKVLSYKENKKLLVTIQNIGLKEIGTLKVTNSIYADDESKKYSESINNLLPDQEFNISIDLDQISGVYSHNTLVNYDGLEKNITESLIIGKPDVLINNLLIDGLKLGEINQINVSLSSNWNQPIDNLSVEVDVFKGEKLITTIKSLTITLDKNVATKLFLDTKGYSEGEYKFVTKILKSDIIISQKEFLIMLKEKDVITQKHLSKNITNFIILSMSIFLLAIIVLLFEKIKKIPQEEKKEEKPLILDEKNKTKNKIIRKKKKRKTRKKKNK